MTVPRALWRAKLGPAPVWIGIVTLLALVYVIAGLSGELAKHFTLAVGAQVIIGLGAAGFALRQSKLAGWSKAWLLLSASTFLTQVATAGFLVNSLVSRDESAPWLLFAIYLATYPLLYAALILLPREGGGPKRRPDLETVGSWLDFIIVLLAGGTAITFLWLIPALRANQTDTAASVFVTANAIADLLLVAAVARYALLKRRELPPASTLLIVLGVLAALTGDVLLGSEEASGGYVAGGAADAVYVIALALLAWAAYCASPRREERAARQWPDAKPFTAILPLAAVLLTLSLLLVEFRGSLSLTLGALLLCAMAVVLMVVARQLVAVFENGRLQASRATHQSEARFRSLVTNSSDVILVTEADTAVSYASPSAERILDVRDGTSDGSRLIDLVHPDIRSSALTTITGSLEQPGGQVNSEWLLRSAQGDWRHFDVTIANMIDDPVVQGLVLTMRDVEERVRFERELERQVFYDPLTKLANRVLLRDRLEHALVRASRTGGQLAVLFADLDDFKLVNDHLGHLFGDDLLIQVAGRLQTVLRSSDTAARLGGDEFSILLEDTPDVFHATNVAEKALACLSEPFTVGSSTVSISASIGIAISTGDCTAEELLRNADIAMYSAKNAGKNRFEVFEPNMQVAIRSRLELQADLRRAITEHEFVVYYQPIVEIASGRLVSLEALARWNHPNRGLLLPAEFIGVAERTGQITALGHQVLLEACRQAKAWEETAPDGRPLTMAVNLSPRQIREPLIVSLISEALDSSGLEPSRLVLEVTEVALIEDEQLTCTKLWAIKQLGVQLSIDDFGTGYSSLNRLHAFPFDCVKIAKPFVDHVAEGVNKSAVARAIIGLADSLDLNVVAEGIEYEEQRSSLVDLGCRLGQGFHFARPMDSEKMSVFLAAANADFAVPQD